MSIRKFSAGDIVKLKEKNIGPEMVVHGYHPKKEPIFGFIDKNSYVECFWYKNGTKRTRMFHQDQLKKYHER
jgi:uncharacterized protein YodC (DUF2158 family)